MAVEKIIYLTVSDFRCGGESYWLAKRHPEYAKRVTEALMTFLEITSAKLPYLGLRETPKVTLLEFLTHIMYFELDYRDHVTSSEELARTAEALLLEAVYTPFIELFQKGRLSFEQYQNLVKCIDQLTFFFRNPRLQAVLRNAKAKMFYDLGN